MITSGRNSNSNLTSLTAPGEEPVVAGLPPLGDLGAAEEDVHLVVGHGQPLQVVVLHPVVCSLVNLGRYLDDISNLIIVQHKLDS